MTEPRFEPLARRTFVADAIRTIKDMILDGRLAPGQRLPSERALSEALGISRPTVREAIRSLQAMHILESRHGAGTFVASLSVEELLAPLQFVLSLADGGLEHLFEVRLMLEPGAAALARRSVRAPRKWMGCATARHVPSMRSTIPTRCFGSTQSSTSESSGPPRIRCSSTCWRPRRHSARRAGPLPRGCPAY